ncbi:cell division protein MraZ [Zhihengliuella sp. ISTPL4]|uniref:cell division protein MraZ n=1 Tax=Zhihengliuella sp. ISTPL4 TaxID=2058657 RepID=UPI000C7D65C2|nr:cell division protein MraZ [Zhihengliuella sp. ISTPL4]
MTAAFTASLDNHGHLVISGELRARQRWSEGVPLLMIEEDRGGVVLVAREQARTLVRAQLTGASLANALHDERRAAAAQEDAA